MIMPNSTTHFKANEEQNAPAKVWYAILEMIATAIIYVQSS